MPSCKIEITDISKEGRNNLRHTKAKNCVIPRNIIRLRIGIPDELYSSVGKVVCCHHRTTIRDQSTHKTEHMTPQSYAVVVSAVRTIVLQTNLAGSAIVGSSKSCVAKPTP